VIMNQVIGSIGEPRGRSARNNRDSSMRRVRSTAQNERRDSIQQPNRRWVEHSRTTRALDLVFTLYFSEQISNSVGARKSEERGKK